MIAEKAIAVGAGAVVLANGDRVEAGGVIDARGAADMSMLDLGWQKFVGRELVLAAPHGVERPTVMDATVEQIDGYRFVYCLPFGERRMFVEDTYYSDTPDIDRAALTERIDAYAAAKGWQVESVAREEAGALPVAIGGDFDAFWRARRGEDRQGGAARRAVPPDHRLFAARRDPPRGRDRRGERPVVRRAARSDLWHGEARVGRPRLLPHARRDAVPRRRAG